MFKKWIFLFAVILINTGFSNYSHGIKADSINIEDNSGITNKTPVKSKENTGLMEIEIISYPVLMDGDLIELIKGSFNVNVAVVNSSIGLKYGCSFFQYTGLEAEVQYINLTMIPDGYDSMSVGNMEILKLGIFYRFPVFNNSFFVLFLKPHCGMNYTLFSFTSDFTDLFSTPYPYYSSYNGILGGFGGQAGLNFCLMFNLNLEINYGIEICMERVSVTGLPKIFNIRNISFPISIGYRF